MAPEFAELLRQADDSDRVGYVFTPAARMPSCGRLGTQQVRRVIQDVGRLANIVVSEGGQKRKFASAHDLRRSFGLRWSERVMPQVLKELMRHASIETTMKYYVGQNAQRTAAQLWKAASDLGDQTGDHEKTGVRHIAKPR